MRSVRVLQITGTFPASGKQQVPVKLTNLVQRERYRTDLFTTRSEGALADQVAEYFDKLLLARRKRFDFDALRRLVAFIRVHQFEILHAHNMSTFVAAAASLFPPFPIVVWHNHYSFFESKGSPIGPIWPYRFDNLHPLFVPQLASFTHG